MEKNIYQLMRQEYHPTGKLFSFWKMSQPMEKKISQSENNISQWGNNISQWGKNGSQQRNNIR